MANLAFIQTATARVNPGTTGTVSFSSNNMVGNLLVLFVFYYGATTISVPVDSAGNTWTQIAQKTGGTSPLAVVAFSVPSCRGGANTVTVNSSNSVQYIMRIAEYEGYSAFDTSAGNSISSPTSGTRSAGPLALAGKDLICFEVGNSSVPGTIVPASGYTTEAEGILDVFIDGLAPTAGSTPSYTDSASVYWTGLAVAFLPAISVGGVGSLGLGFGLGPIGKYNQGEI